jgi:hypothetical protein
MRKLLFIICALITTSVDAAKICAGPTGTVRAIYPVGSIYISTSNTNPAGLFGFGTWEIFGNGRVLVGVNESETEFNTVMKTGGEKTHALTIAEMPSHNHKVDHDTLAMYGDGPQANGGDGLAPEATISTQNTGGGQPHNNLQPYITVYMWRRKS